MRRFGAALVALVVVFGAATSASAQVTYENPTNTACAQLVGAQPATGDACHTSKPLRTRGDRYVPQPAGTKKSYSFWFGPYAVPPGHDANRVDLELPLEDGYIIAVEPGMRNVLDNTEPNHQTAHIHHAHWFAFDPGNEEDNYTGGNTEWIFGNGDEETRADFSERSMANEDPNGQMGVDEATDGPAYGQFVGRSAPQLMIYMLHNKTAQPLNVYIELKVDFIHGTEETIKTATGREYHDITGVLFGDTYNVGRGEDKDGDGRFEYAEDRPGDYNSGDVVWTSTVDGVMIGTGGHLHPGGTRVYVENYGSAANPCPSTGEGYGGTDLLLSDAIFNNDVLYSEDFQMEVTRPQWRAPIRKGDRIRLSGTYAVANNAWYTVMTHEGIYVDERQSPDSIDPDRDCSPILMNGTPGDPADGIPSRPWSHESHDTFCERPGEDYGNVPECEPPFTENPEEGIETNTIAIANFLYLPGDRGLEGRLGAAPTVKKGTGLTFVNADQPAGIRHTVTTCEWPCNGRYVANYPWPDGTWDSKTMGYDVVDGGQQNPTSVLDTNSLDPGKYAYFCRIHPWMRGAFEITP